MLEAGIKGHGETVVDHTNTAKFVGSGELEVFATPSMHSFILGSSGSARSYIWAMLQYVTARSFSGC